MKVFSNINKNSGVNNYFVDSMIIHKEYPKYRHYRGRYKKKKPMVVEEVKSKSKKNKKRWREKHETQSKTINHKRSNKGKYQNFCSSCGSFLKGKFCHNCGEKS